MASTMASTSRTDALPGVSYIYKMIHSVLRNCVDSEDMLIKFDKKLFIQRNNITFSTRKYFHSYNKVKKKKRKI